VGGLVQGEPSSSSLFFPGRVQEGGGKCSTKSCDCVTIEYGLLKWVTERRCAMGDKGGKKDKDKAQKQKMKKEKEKARKKSEKQQK
jgi:hypothetical protein